MVVLLCIRVFRRIGIIHAVYVLCQQDDFCPDLRRAQHSCRIGREKRVACAAAENYHTALFQMTRCTLTDIRLRNAVHLDRGLHAHRHIPLLKRIRQRERIDRRRQHSHVVCAGALHFAAAVLNAAPEVATADDNADLAAFLIALFDYVTYRPDHIKIQAEMLIPCKRFAADLDQHALIFRCSHIPHSLLLIPAFYSTLLPPVLQRVFKIFQGNLQLLLCRIQKFQMTA